DVTQEEVDEAAEALETAIKGLVKQGTPGKEEETEDEKKPGPGSSEPNKPDSGESETGKGEMETGEKLPNTATNIGNLLLLGFGFIALSLILLFARRQKKVKA